MSAQLLHRAQAGDREAFTVLVEPYRRELQVHCYRMLGSLQDAEDAVQETLLSAWVGIEAFEGRSSVRTWLYRVATNRCLNVLRASSRRPMAAEPLPIPAPEPTRMGEVPWLQPYPDVLLDGVSDEAPGPEARYESREAISLAFVAAMQLLPPNQRAVLLLRDVLGYRAGEAADLLNITEDAVTNALKRARATMESSHSRAVASLEPGSAEERDLLERFVSAFTNFDIDGLVELMTDDAWVRMPPLPFEYRGREAIHQFFSALRPVHGGYGRMVATRANGQPAFGGYQPDPVTGVLHLTSILTMTISGDRVSEFVRFETSLAPYFCLPRTLEGV
jgi:RNA polymerase sigma-70 factor (ECF subfamily)